MPSFLKPLVKLVLAVGLLVGAAPGPANSQSVPPLGPRKTFPHFRPAEKRKLKHYKPKTWREKVPEPKPRPQVAEKPQSTP